jgi:hypothetical protein
VSDVWARIRSNPHLARKHNLPDSRAGVEEMVDSYNALICEQNGWLEFIQSGVEEAAPIPKWVNPQTSHRLGGKLAAGAKALLQWLGEGGEPVKPELAQARAAVCAKCPLNRKMELKDFFVHGAAELIRRQIEFAKECGLNTPYDEQLGICSNKERNHGCECVLTLSVHCPLKHKLSTMKKDVYDSLDEGCWVKTENATTVANVPDE